MGATKDYSVERCSKTDPKDQEEEFLSLSPVVEERRGETHHASDSEDFISLGLINEENKTNCDEASENGSIAKNRKERNFERLISLPPWMEGYVDYRRINPLVALHNEIVSFCKLMEPRTDEMKTRQELVDKFTVLAKSTFNTCKVEVFGSQATGYVDQTSGLNS